VKMTSTSSSNCSRQTMVSIFMIILLFAHCGLACGKSRSGLSIA
jgi:hypothetical protein